MAQTTSPTAEIEKLFDALIAKAEADPRAVLGPHVKVLKRLRVEAVSSFTVVAGILAEKPAETPAE